LHGFDGEARILKIKTLHPKEDEAFAPRYHLNSTLRLLFVADQHQPAR